MGSTIRLQETLHVGQPAVYPCNSPANSFSVVFEDDGDTGYLYAYDRSRPESPILDALHIYNVAAVTDRERPSTLQVAWSDDGLKAVAILNRSPHAVFDFEARRGYCRTNYPPPDPAWTSHGHAWDDAAIHLFQ